VTSTVPELEARPLHPPRRRRGLRSQSGWILRRIALAVLSLLIVSALIFVATQALPSDPARAILGHEAQPAALANLRQQLGLDRPLVDQYGSWLGGVVTGDLGRSYAAQEPAWQVIEPRLVNSVELALMALAVIVPLSLAIGVLTAVRRDRIGDHVFNALSIVVYALPEFVVGIILIALFSTTVWQALPAVALVPPGDSPVQHLKALVLPLATLVLVTVPYLARLVRAAMIDALESDYVELARLKGLASRRVTLAHALPNALVPSLQGLALIIGYLAGGIVIIEVVFDYPGIGSLLATSITARDLPVVQAVVLILASVYIVVNLLADIGTVLLTPRLRSAH
jgi:peptide/nickel transport system permease protein